MPESATSPTVSVVVPVYNRLTFLPDTIDSVLHQTFCDWELIVVDDGSQEDVAGFLRRYSDSRITLLGQTNQGNAVARNTGIAAATGDFVACLDSDDAWEPEFLGSCVEFLSQHAETDVAYTRVTAVDAQGRPIPRSRIRTARSGDLLEPLLMGYPILPSSAVVRHSCFERWGAYTPGLDDWELWLRWAAQGCRFASIDQPLVRYRLHDQNLNLQWMQRREAHFNMLDRFYQRESLPPVALRLRDRAYANQYFRFAVLAWQLGRAEDGSDQFIQAVLKHPEYLTDLDFYTQIACAHQGRIDAGTSRALDLPTAVETLQICLDALFAQSQLPAAIRQRGSQAHAWARLALARLAYGVAHDMSAARRLLLNSLRAWPPVVWTTDWLLWLGRSLLGFDRIQRLKGWVRPPGGSACRQ